jgi:hypothetical protein
MSEYHERARHYQAAIRIVLLAEWDPIGISEIPEAQDEYDSYVGGVYSLLTRRYVDRHEVFAHLWQIETEYMGLNGNRPHTEAVVDRLLRLRDEMEKDSG